MASSFLSVNELQSQVRISITKSLAESIGEGASKAMREFAANANKNVATKKGMLQANRDIASGVRDTVLRAYDQRVTARKPTESYRIGDRFSGGRLRGALGSEGMFVGTADGIAWGDIVTLDREAAHWYRLNYGAGSIADELYQAASVSIPFPGGSLGPISLDSPPSEDFFMPRGWPRRPGTPFYPTGRDLLFPTRGIAARRFFDTGLSKLRELVPDVYGRVFPELLSK